ncbi:MAG: peptidylprolyl isomerase [Phycisphaerae bacterium]|nr:peptidylprolyl isomerase [Phycisphaerae bacterium]
MTKQMTIRIGLISVTVCTLLGGCKSKPPQGKFTEEQMETIPYANKYELPEATGGMTLRIYSETIPIDEILRYAEQSLKPYAEKTDQATFEVQALPFIRETIKGKVTDILLYQEARKTTTENIDESLEKAVESEVSRFVTGYDNNYALAERAIKQMGMNWKSFREYQKKLILTQSYISSTLKEEKRFSYRDLLDYYESVKDKQFSQIGFVEFSVIDIVPAKLTDEQIAEGETPETAAARIANELLDRLIANDEDFAELAKQYSHGPFAKQGGKLQPVTTGSDSLAEPYATLEKQALQMQPGQTKGPIAIDEHLFILHMDKIQHAEVKSFPEVQKQVEQQLQFQYRQKQYLELVQKLIQKTDIVQLEQFAKFCTKEAYNRWGSQ